MLELLYRTLGLPTSATIEEVKKAYRNLAKEYHPDKNKEGAEKFKEINNAYNTIIDPEARRKYIQKNANTYSSQADAYNPFASQSFNFNSSQSSNQPPKYNHSQQYSQSQQQQQQQQRSDSSQKTPKPKKYYNIYSECKVTLEDIYNGNTIKVPYQEKIECSTCEGFSTHPNLERLTKCKQCEGTGIFDRNVRGRTPIRCYHCNGIGNEKHYKQCPECKNKRHYDKIASVKIPKGVHDGHTLQLNNLGCLLPDETRGALFLRIHELPHAIFKRQGDNLYVTVSLGLKEALIGFKNKILCIHLDGRIIAASQLDGKVIQPNSKKVVQGEGMPIFNTNQNIYGDLIVTFDVKFPERVQLPTSPSEMAVIDALFDSNTNREDPIIINDEEEEEVEVEEEEKEKEEEKVYIDPDLEAVFSQAEPFEISDDEEVDTNGY